VDVTSIPSSSCIATCLRCGLTQHLAPPPAGAVAQCAACRADLLRRRKPGAISATAACALAALAIYPAAISLPVLQLSKLGHTRPVTIWSGAVDLLLGGQVAIGILVFLCSIVIPILKLIGILGLDLGRPWRRAGTRRAVHRAIDWIGRWSMLDILLIAIIVAAIKFGNFANIHPGPGAAAFAALVVLSMLSSALFKPDLGATE
jgi:paraquat-inducible protein A